MKRIAWGLLAALFAFAAPARADWPTKPIHIVVTFAPGGAADIWARIIAEPLSKALSQSVVVENRGGGGGIVAATQVARAEPDGYTILMGGLAPQILAPAIAGNAGFDALRDFTHIAYIGGPPIVLGGAAVERIAFGRRYLIAAAKADKFSGYASSGVGTLGHLVVEYVAKRHNLKLTHIPYNTAAFADIIAGRVPMGSFTWGAALGQVQGGTLARARRDHRGAAAGSAGRADLQGAGLRSRRQHLVLVLRTEGPAEGDRAAIEPGNHPHPGVAGGQEARHPGRLRSEAVDAGPAHGIHGNRDRALDTRSRKKQ